MAAARRGEDPGLIEQLAREPYRFSFFQAVRVLERYAREARHPQGNPTPHAPVGHDTHPTAEAVRFRSLPSLQFPPGEVASYQRPEPSRDPSEPLPPPEMVVSFFGLTGPLGALPQHYTSLLIERLASYKDETLRDFLDVFNHRLVSLFYRAWEKYRFAYGYERVKVDAIADPKAKETDDLFTQVLYCLVGMGTPGLRRRLRIDDEAILYYGGIFAHYPRSAAALAGMLVDYFRLPIEVEQFSPQWLYLSLEDRSQLPSGRHPEGLNCRLGQDVVIGERIRSVESKLRIRLGPLTYAQLARFMPDGDSLRPLCQLVRLYLGPEYDFDVQLILLAEEVPNCRLGGGGFAARLGWNTWVHSFPYHDDVDDPVFTLAEG